MLPPRRSLETARARCTKPGSDRCFTVNTIDYRLLIIDITLCASIPHSALTLDWTTSRESSLENFMFEHP